MAIIIKPKKQSFYISGLFFCLSYLCVYGYLPSVAGLLVLVFFVAMQTVYAVAYFKNNERNYSFPYFLWILIYHTVAMSIIYYLFGFSKYILLVWIFINCSLMLFLKNEFNYKEFLSRVYQSAREMVIGIDLSNGVLLIILTYFAGNFLSSPIANGSPTPWINALPLDYILFFAATLIYLFCALKQKVNPLNTFGYFLAIIGLVACKYILSFGYDTLLHQAALNYIAENSKILPLTPYYIGQYVFELAIHYFTAWPFIIIERWFLPLMFIFLTIATGNYFLKCLNYKFGINIIPIAILALVPNQFYFSSPYAYSLVWGMVSVIFLFIYLVKGKMIDFKLALAASIASLFIHPFVGLSLAIGVVFVYLYINTNNGIKKNIIIAGSFLLSSFAVVASFSIYNWYNNHVILIADPIYYLKNFLNLFGDPIWYSKTSYSTGDWLIYIYEKYYFIFIFMAMIYAVCLKNKRKGIKKEYFLILFISFCSFISSWLFVSGIEISGYVYGDQINYSYRLLQAAKWLLWPLFLIFILKAFNIIKNIKNQTIFFLIIFASSLFFTINWYIIFPRNDDISRININNIRAVDYEAIDFIYKIENGKGGYLVFANQLFGAGAIQKYGFNPYYDSKWGNLFYYSIPMGSELNQRYEKIMSSETFNKNLIYEPMEDIGLNKSYLIVTDYWPLSKTAKQEILLESKANWIIKDNVEIYFFTFD